MPPRTCWSTGRRFVRGAGRRRVRRRRRLAFHVHLSARAVSRAVPAARPDRVRHVRLFHAGDLDTGGRTSRHRSSADVGGIEQLSAPRGPVLPARRPDDERGWLFCSAHRSCTRDGRSDARRAGTRERDRVHDFRGHLRRLVGGDARRRLGDDPGDETGGVSAPDSPRT